MLFLEWTFYGNTLAEWLLALGAAVAVYVALTLTKSLVLRQLGRLAGHTRNDLDDMLVAVLQRTRVFILVIVALLAGAQFVVLDPSVATLIRWAAIVVVVVQVGLWGNTAIVFYVDRQVKRQLEEDAAGATTVNALGFVGRLALWSFLLLVALDNFGVDITALVAGLGIGGIAVALALQNILGDLFASLSIVLDKPFVIGDFIIVGDLLGTVEYVGLKTTRIRSLSGEQIIFNNSDLLGARIRNFKRMYERRVVCVFGVVYGTEYEKLVEIPKVVQEAVESLPDTRFDRAHFKGYGDFSLDFEYVYYVLVPDYGVYMDRQQSINLTLYKRFQEMDVEFAFPTQTLYVRR